MHVRMKPRQASFRILLILAIRGFREEFATRTMGYYSGNRRQARIPSMSAANDPNAGHLGATRQIGRRSTDDSRQSQFR